MEIRPVNQMQFLTGRPMGGVPRKGPELELIVGDERHIAMRGANPLAPQAGTVNAVKGAAKADFASVLNEAIKGVEDYDNRSQDLTAKSVFDPDSVEAHQVVIAAEKARFALNLTKTLADGFVRTFRDLSNPR